MCPAPCSNGVDALPVAASFIGRYVLSCTYAVVISADLICAGLQSGWLALISAATPATCGHDMDVPDRMLNPTRRLSLDKLDGLASPLHAAKMFTPGATTSGLRISRVRMFGPRDENAATTGDGRMPSLVPPKLSVAVGFGALLL
ncbi:Os04g0573200 [Oryza sativa Japonica Group]|uniref:Os04g0573200 protein n=1 Tax=Oryza sativa subsp. japonica TaxID=39947 RepID=A0A0P0WDQ8_ORYSJ|nr:hypothetical protein EE612_025061 [Oryza sativa]KAB8096565.1 hypothetical protein EE612_025061 [Oryza sativa]BAS90591.1 Os04g0573200 [Oryza sativa Japonica Group]